MREFWTPIPVRIEEQPELAELIAEPPPLPPTVAGLYEGVPPLDPTAEDRRPTALRLFRRNLARCRSLAEVAERAGIDPRTLYSKMRRHGLRREDYR